MLHLLDCAELGGIWDEDLCHPSSNFFLQNLVVPFFFEADLCERMAPLKFPKETPSRETLKIFQRESNSRQDPCSVDFALETPDSDLNFAVDFLVDLFLLFFPRKKAKKNPPKIPPQNSPRTLFGKIP